MSMSVLQLRDPKMDKPMKRISKLILATASAAVAPTPALVWAQQPPEPNRYGYRPYIMGPHMMDLAGGWYGMIFCPPFIILALLVLGARLLLPSVGGPQLPRSP